MGVIKHISLLCIYPFYILKKTKLERVKEGKKDEQMVRIKESVGHAQAQGMARRII